VNSASQTALLERSGIQAPYLLLTEAYESGSWASVRDIAEEIGLPPEMVAGLYRDSISWAQQTVAVKAA
jgi:hypothetical protein